MNFHPPWNLVASRLLCAMEAAFVRIWIWHADLALHGLYRLTFWADRENALTGADAQAFKRACPASDWDPICTTLMGNGSTSNSTACQRRLRDCRDGQHQTHGSLGCDRSLAETVARLSAANGQHWNGDSASQGANGNHQNLVAQIEAMEKKIGKRLYRGLLKRVAAVRSPHRFARPPCSARCWRRCRGAERGLARLEAAQARLGPEIVQRIVVSLNTPQAKLEDLQTLHALVTTLEKEVELAQAQT